MFLITRTVALIITVVLIPGTALAQASLIRASSSTPILDSGRRQVKKLTGVSARRNQGIPTPRAAAAFALGALIGGYAGMYAGARVCHCESPAPLVTGMLLGGGTAIWLVQKLARP